MTDRTVPAPGTAYLDLGKWFRDYVGEGDTVHLAEGRTYWTESFTLEDHPDDIMIQGHDATLEVRTPPPAYGQWNAPFKVVKGNGLKVFDLNIKGCKTPGSGFNRAYEGQHGFTIQGANDTILCRPSSDASWGDGIYISDSDDETPTRNLIVCEPKLTNVGRNAVTTVGAEDVLIADLEASDIMRTGFNFEVHPGSHVRRVEIAGAKFGSYGLLNITATGSGEASDIYIHDLVVPSTEKWNALVAGVGAEVYQPSGRPYGIRRNWRIENVSGSASHLGRDYYIKLLCVDGLTLRNVPYPMQTSGSRLV